jgi:hypothetical protein
MAVFAVRLVTVSFSRVTTPDILVVSNWLEMVWIDAEFLPAKMVKFQPAWNLPTCPLVGEDVGMNTSSILATPLASVPTCVPKEPDPTGSDVPPILDAVPICLVDPSTAERIVSGEISAIFATDRDSTSTRAQREIILRPAAIERLW